MKQVNMYQQPTASGGTIDARQSTMRAETQTHEYARPPHRAQFRFFVFLSFVSFDCARIDFASLLSSFDSVTLVTQSHRCKGYDVASVDIGCKQRIRRGAKHVAAFVGLSHCERRTQCKRQCRQFGWVIVD
jgi:hypothetical protein